jgi:hypothetical protein
LNWESGGWETGAFGKRYGFQPANRFEEKDFYADGLSNRRISFGFIHLGSGIIWF